MIHRCQAFSRRFCCHCNSTSSAADPTAARSAARMPRVSIACNVGIKAHQSGFIPGPNTLPGLGLPPARHVAGTATPPELVTPLPNPYYNQAPSDPKKSLARKVVIFYIYRIIARHRPPRVPAPPTNFYRYQYRYMYVLLVPVCCYRPAPPPASSVVTPRSEIAGS